MSALSAADASNLFRREPDRYIDVGIGEVAYRSVGSGPDVLFVHGWPLNSATFRGLLPYLAEHVACHLIDLPGTGSSRYAHGAPVTLRSHIESVRQVVDALDLTSASVVGHNSGGMIARHALADDDRVRSWGLINTEQPQGLSWRFKAFLAIRNAPAVGAVLAWAVGKKQLRKNKWVLGDAFADRSVMDGEFDEFFLQPLATDKKLMDATIALLKSFSADDVAALGDLHKKMSAPVRLVWGAEDKFFPIAWAREMVATFPDASLVEIPNAGLMSHEERPRAVAEALRPVLTD